MRRGQHRATRFTPRPADFGAAVNPERHVRSVPLGEIYARLQFDDFVSEVDRRVANAIGAGR